MRLGCSLVMMEEEEEVEVEGEEGSSELFGWKEGGEGSNKGRVIWSKVVKGGVGSCTTNRPDLFFSLPRYGLPDLRLADFRNVYLLTHHLEVDVEVPLLVVCPPSPPPPPWICAVGRLQTKATPPAHACYLRYACPRPAQLSQLAIE